MVMGTWSAVGAGVWYVAAAAGVKTEESAALTGLYCVHGTNQAQVDRDQFLS